MDKPTPGDMKDRAGHDAETADATRDRDHVQHQDGRNDGRQGETGRAPTDRDHVRQGDQTAPDNGREVPDSTRG